MPIIRVEFISFKNPYRTVSEWGEQSKRQFFLQRKGDFGSVATVLCTMRKKLD